MQQAGIDVTSELVFPLRDTPNRGVSQNLFSALWTTALCLRDSVKLSQFLGCNTIGPDNLCHNDIT